MFVPEALPLSGLRVSPDKAFTPHPGRHRTQACLADASSAPTNINNEPNTLFSAFN